jgi:hypothetical protein
MTVDDWEFLGISTERALGIIEVQKQERTRQAGDPGRCRNAVVSVLFAVCGDRAMAAACLCVCVCVACAGLRQQTGELCM